ncbi:MAG: ribose-phosphate pyrophosphokinase [Bacillota bacterium]
MESLDELRKNSQIIPVGPLGIIALEGSKELAGLINDYILKRRLEFIQKNAENHPFMGFIRESYLVECKCPRFANGEGKAVLEETVRGYDIYIIADVGNYNCKFKMFGVDHPMSPDDHFQDIKRTIAAIAGKAKHLTVIMPMLYEGRQHKRQSRESLDCAIALQELAYLGIDSIITFDAHDPRVNNAVPLKGFENLHSAYQIIRAILKNEKDLQVDKSHMLVVSPDEGAMERSLYYANILGLDLSLFYKRRDYTRIVNGKNPIVKHEFLGDDVAGKDVLIIDDMLSSGESILDIARELKKRRANRIYIAVTFALFTEGITVFDEGYRQGIFNRLYATNLTYRREELRKAPWYVDVDMSEFLAHLIDMLNQDSSISSLFDPSEKIGNLLRNYQVQQNEVK